MNGKWVIPPEVRTECLILRMPMGLRPDGVRSDHGIAAGTSDLVGVGAARTEPRAIAGERLDSTESVLTKKDLRYYVFYATSDKFLGHRIDWKIPKFEIGFWVQRPPRGRAM